MGSDGDEAAGGSGVTESLDRWAERAMKVALANRNNRNNRNTNPKE